MSDIASNSEELAVINRQLFQKSAHERIAWALENLPGEHVLSSSFGIQAALMLHLVNEVAPGIPVVFVDTGYHFKETYEFVDHLSQRLHLNLQVYRAKHSAAWQEARYGQRWEQGAEAIAAYNQENKVEPMQRALAELSANTWFSGLRRNQSASRAQLEVVAQQWQRCKVHPILDWSDRDVYQYLTAHDLPYHPLREEGYISIGDWHTTRSLKDVDTEEEARFFGLMRECGLHELPDPQTQS